MNHPYPHFAMAVRALGPTVPDIARVMGVSIRSVTSYLGGSALPRVEVVKRIPALDIALTLDLAPRTADPARNMRETAKNWSLIAP